MLYSSVCPTQSLVDEEVSMIVQEMLQVLLDCFMNLTGRTERVVPVVVSVRIPGLHPNCYGADVVMFRIQC